MIPSELFGKQRKGQGPCTLAQRAQREPTEPVITVIRIEKRERVDERERESEM